MNLLLGHDQAVADWVASILGKPFQAPFTAFGLVDGAGHLRGGFVFTGYTGDAIEMSVAGAGCMTRGAWRAVDEYVFRQLRCARLQVHTRKDNKRVRRLAPKLGFHHEGTARRLYGAMDGYAYSLTRDDMPAFRKRWRL